MKKLLPILLLLSLLLGSCVKDDIALCPGYLHCHFDYQYGGKNCFFEDVHTDLTMHFFHQDGPKYRQEEVQRNLIAIDKPLRLSKSIFSGDFDIVAWSHDPAVTYHHPNPMSSPSEGYVQLNEITPAAEGIPAICQPIEDLFYGRLSFASDRYERTDITIPFVRAVCRVRITLIPSTVQNRSDNINDNNNNHHSATPRALYPSADEYVFRLRGTYNRIDYNNVTSGEPIILEPPTHFDEASGNIRTNYFGALSSLGDFLKVDVLLRGHLVASFDCTPLELDSTPGRFIDLYIDGKYIRPELSVWVNGWQQSINIISDL